MTPMARSTKAIHAPEVEFEDEDGIVEWEDYEPSPALRLVWLAALVLWGLVAAAMISYNPADPPGHAVAPLNAPDAIANWIGPVGAAASHHLFLLLGSGAWIVLLSTGAYLFYIAFRGAIDHAIVRFLGVLMVAIAFSSFHNLFLPGASAMPEGSGGLLAILAVHELSTRFGTLGATLWIGLFAAIGATVAYDRWLIIVPQAVAQAAFSASDRAGTALDALQTRRRAARANDIDDDATLATVTTVVRNAAKRTKGVADEDESERPQRVLKKRRAPEPAAVEADEYEEDEVEAAEGDYEDEDADDVGPNAPQVFTEDQLRDKIAKLPVRFAQANKKLASEDDLEALRAQRRSEEEAERNYVYPGLDLLTDPEENYADELEEFIRDQAAALEHALATYKIDGHVAGVDSGPVITLYQVLLAPGTKVSSVNAVASDLARMLKATNIRIVPNTEGLDTIGIEVPNSKKEKVRLKELMACSDSTKRMRLPLFLGKDASGAPLIVDLTALPHLLIAGTTGSGKSVCMNAVIMGFLYTQKPSDLKLVLVDPKMVELSQFKDIPHLMCPVVTEMSKAAAILEWAVTKMDERYELLAEAGCRDINAYNALGWDQLKERLNPANEIQEARIPRKLPYLVFVIDELADLIMTNKEVEVAIVRIAQKARAVGIHLILATQRPQANVVTGLIKSNMPGRVAFKVASAMDSRIVLDQKGAELLLGMGDMLMLTPRSSATIRAQGTLVDDGETRRVVRFIREHAGQNFEGALVSITNHGYKAQIHEERMREHAQEDPLFDRAVEMIIESGRGSVSMLQRQLAIGYTRAARLIEMMGEAGILGDHKGTVARDVVMTIDEWRALKELAENEPTMPIDEAERRLASQPKLFADDEPTGAPLKGGLDHETGVTAAETSALLAHGMVTQRTDDEERIIDHAPTGADQYANRVPLDDDDDWTSDESEEGVARETTAELEAARTLPRDITVRAERALDEATRPAPGAVASARAEFEEEEEEAPFDIAEPEDVEEEEEEAEAEFVDEADEEEADEEYEEAEDEYEEEEEEEDEDPEAEYEEVDEEEEEAEVAGAADEDETEAEDEYEEGDEDVEAEDELEEDAEAEYEEEGEEYEYEYVDENGNPIAPEDLEEYEYENAEDGAESEGTKVADAPAAASPEPPAPKRPEIRINGKRPTHHHHPAA